MQPSKLGSLKLPKIQNIFRTSFLNSHSIFSNFLKNIGIGRFAFWLRLILIKFEILVLNRHNQRFIEYSWVLRQLRSGGERILLDVGCTGTLLDHELLARGFRVVGLDIQDHTLRNYREVFLKTNILNNRLPSEIFDVIVLVSTIEHIGLDTYSQDILDDDADLSAMQELRRLLKPNGLLLLTTPYEGKGPSRIHSWGKGFLGRRYDCKRLAQLLRGFIVVHSTFFLCRLKPRCRFFPIKKIALDNLFSDMCEGSLACLVLQKN